MGSVYEILFNSKIQDSLKDLLSLMHHDESGYMETTTENQKAAQMPMEIIDQETGEVTKV